jgi:Domain of unknown function (DUF6745)
MRERIAALSSAQAAQLPDFRESWRKTALATARIDPVAARRAVRDLYRAFELPEPKVVICLDSPMACLIARGILVALLRQTLRLRVVPTRRQPSFYDRNFPKRLCDELDEPFSVRIWHAMWGQLREQLGRARWRPLVALFRDVVELQLYGVMGEPLGHSLSAQLSDQLTPQLQEELVNETLTALWRQTGRALQDHIDAQIRYELSGDINDRSDQGQGTYLRSELPPGERWQQACFVGGQAASWLAFYDFAERIGAQYEAQSKLRFEAYKEYARGCGWMYAFRSVAFVSDRPAEIHFDAQRRLHHATGMAVRYCDGWGAHVWHGTGVPGWLIEQRDKITPRSIADLANVELRRVALEIYGFDRYLAARKAKVVAADELHGQPRRLLEVEVGGHPFRIIEVVNGSLQPDGTRRKFHLGA